MENGREEKEKQLEHKLLLTHIEKNGVWRDICSCGASWTHPASRSSKEMDEIFQSHLKYFNKPKTQTL